MDRGTSVRDVWDALRARFNVEEWNIPDEWRAERTDSPAGKIVRALNRRHDPKDGAPMFLLAGTIGTGKSTELWRIADEMNRGGKHFVVFVDLVRHFNNAFGSVEALQHINSWEVCFLCGVALIRAARELGYTWDEEKVQGLADAWSALARATLPAGAAPPTIDVFAAAKSLVLFATAAAPLAGAPAGAPVAMKALAELVSAGKWALPMGKEGTKRIEDQDPLMRSLVDKVNLLLGDFRQWSRQVLFVVDGLDRIASFERAEALLLHSQMLARLHASLVVCAPFVMRNNLALMEVRRFQPRILHNVPVLDHSDPNKPGPGVAFFRELFRRRVQDLGAGDLIPQPLLDRLAYYSGGRARDFVRTIGMLADYGYDDAAPVATEPMVQEVLTEARHLIEGGITKDHVAVLEAVARDPKHELPGGQSARELLTYARLLPYPNESEWFYPHPLLMINKVRP